MGEHGARNDSLVKAFMAVLGAVQIVVFWWAFDQTVRLRAVELEQSTQKASLAAVQPFAAHDRATLMSLQHMVTKQGQDAEMTIGLVRDLNTLVQSLAKSQIDFRIAMERLEQRGEAERRLYKR